MRGLVIAVAVTVGLFVTYMAIHTALIEIGQEVVVLHKETGDGAPSMTRLWIVDDGEYAWLHHEGADAAWIQRLRADPIVEIDRGGETQQYRGAPDPEADPKVHRLLREKYGFADWLVRFWWGTDTETGLRTGSTCSAVPVRLEPL